VVAGVGLRFCVGLMFSRSEWLFAFSDHVSGVVVLFPGARNT